MTTYETAEQAHRETLLRLLRERRFSACSLGGVLGIGEHRTLEILLRMSNEDPPTVRCEIQGRRPDILDRWEITEAGRQQVPAGA